MRKSFKRALAAVLAVLMVVCAFPMTASAALGDYEPNIDLRFGTFFSDNYMTWNDYHDFGEGANKQDGYTGPVGMFGPALQYNKTAGTLTLTAASTEGYEDYWGVAPLDADYTYGVGDYFTVTVLLNNVAQVYGTEGYIKYSDNIAPAGAWSTSGAAKNRSYYMGTQKEYEADGTASIEVLAPGANLAGQDAASFHDLNTVIDDQQIQDGNIIHYSVVNNTGQNTVDISTLTNDGSEGYEFPNPETGAAPDYDNGDGYDYTNTAILCTFLFKITGEGAITFEVDDPTNEKYNAYLGFYYVADKTEGTSGTALTTYALQDGAAGSAKMTFMGTNSNVAAPECSHANTATTENVTAAPTCTADGSKTVTVTCNDCGEVVSESVVAIPATGHSYGKVVTAPTCTAEGYTTYTCSVCGDTYKGDTVAATGHTNAAPVQEKVVAATCGANGSYDEVVYCSVCGVEVSRNTVTVPATGAHVYETVVDSKDATCTADGYVTKACGCGATDTTVVPATGHTAAAAVVENEVAATCTTDGSYDTVVYCSVCKAEISRQTTTVPATGHSYDKVVTAPTCTAEGYTTFTCSVCGDTYKGDTVAATGHTNAAPVQENVVNATCGADGSYDEVVYCTVCGVEVSRNTVTVPATGEHVYATETDRKEATCTEDGYYVMACGCGAKQTTTIPATGHTAAEAVVENEVAATCTTDGSYDTVVYCSVCNEELSRETSTVPATGHTEVTVPGYDATVDAPGLTDGVQCSVCGTWIVPQNEIPMLDSVIVTVIEPDLGNVTGLACGDNKLAKATSYTLTAEALEGAEFLGWAINGKVVSTATTYTSNAVNDVTIEAMFAEAEGSDAITVTFLDKWGNMVATFNGTVADVQAQLAAGIPTASDIVGYSFVGWDMADEDILAITTSATIWAQYEVKADGYTVTTDAELTLPEGVANGAIPYDTSVTVYAEGATAWKIGDVVVAYGDTYTFYVGADVTVVPVFEAVESAPSVTMIKVTETGTGKFQFLATRNVPDGYKLVNAGFVFGRDMTADELTLENVGTVAASGFTVKVGYCSVNGADQFALNYGVSAGNACAKAFVVYKDAAGAINVIYTDMFVG